MNKECYKEHYTQNRELSWLQFDSRVLSEARDPSVPLLERLKFVSIYANNLNEFFMIRVGSLTDMKNARVNEPDPKSGMTPKQQLDAIYDKVRKTVRKKDRAYMDIMHELEKHGIQEKKIESLSKDQKKFVRAYFMDKIAPFLSPLVIDSLRPFPSLQNSTIHIIARISRKGREEYAVIPIPSSLPSILMLPGKKDSFVLIEDLILSQTEKVFRKTKIISACKIAITRNEDIDPTDDIFEDILDYRKRISRVLKQRNRSAVVRVECSRQLSAQTMNYLCSKLSVTPSQFFYTSIPLNLKFGFILPDLIRNADLKDLVYPPYEPKLTPDFHYRQKLFAQIQKKDVLLSYPYDSMAPFLQLIKEAADDPLVDSIKMTIYRLAHKAKLVEYLCRAAENGKNVVTLIELKARFDEQDNIDYSERLEDAGCTVLYGFEDYKVHSKVCLITRKVQGKAQYVTQIGTGNYNESTAKQYTDLSYMTANTAIARDVNVFFANMMTGNLDGNYRRLLVAPYGMKPALLKLMDQEIAKGKNGRITVKINALTDEELIEKLKQASQAGVTVTMMIRSITCLLPGIPGKTDNISIFSIVGRYLEHSRIYIFGQGKSEKMYISSADFMTRNMERRVEIACPICNPDIQRQIHEILNICMLDNVKARVITSRGRFARRKEKGEPFDAQEELMKRTPASRETIPASVTAERRIIQCFSTPKKKKN